MTKYNSFSTTRLTSATATAVQIFTGPGKLHYITVNTTSAAFIGILDGTSGSIPGIGKLKASVAEGTYRYDATIRNGLRIAPGGHLGDVTISWSTG